MMTEKSIPPGYVRVPSKVSGIEIYQPSPQVEKQKEVVDFSCPQCGANTAYSVEDGGLLCSYCGYYEKPETKIVGKGAQEFEFKVETLERLAQGWGEARKEIVCQSCGANVSLPMNTITVSCPFCGSNKVFQQKAVQSDLRPRFILPFKQNTAAVQEIARQWLGSSWMTPGALKQRALLQEFVPIYLPFWTFDSRCAADWKAEVGHQVTERYYDGKEWKTRTKTEWRWESGRAHSNYDDILVAGTGRLSEMHLETISDYNLQALNEYAPSFLAGIMAKTYDIQLEAAWEVARQKMRESTKEACMAQASTSQVRNFSMNMDFADESWRYVLLPAYLAVYRYDDQSFQVIVNGQTGQISGQRPVDWRKVWLVIGLCLLPGSFLGLLGLITLLLGGVGLVIGGFGFFLLIIGVVVSFVIFQQAQKMDDL
jgi:predicted RNA-binding Zn-ribbon protein involved in translation (DUF1610 family)